MIDNYLLIYAAIICVAVVTIGAAAYKLYRLGYSHAIADKDEFAQKRLAEYRSEQEWEYEDATTPTWRHNRVTGEFQRRYLNPRPGLVKVMMQRRSEIYSSWRSVASADIALM